MMFDAAFGVAGPLRDLTGDMGKPALTGSRSLSFNLEAKLKLVDVARADSGVLMLTYAPSGS